jgi:polyhydroxyalkanoate synthase
MGSRLGHQPYVDPETWYESTPRGDGSWWPAWQQWLARYSSARTAPLPMGAPDTGYPVLEDAPGRYVHQA